MEKKSWEHWGMTREEALRHAAEDLKRLRDERAREMGFPQDGSKGQYDAWTRTLVEAVESAAGEVGLSDGRNAWRKMTPEQRRVFLLWIVTERLPVDRKDFGMEHPIIAAAFPLIPRTRTED